MAIELRVHGVSGSPVETVLDRPWVGQVAGDGDSGFYRPRPEIGGTDGPGGATLEGYRWGSLTSGAAARALWLLLLPFMFANVAIWLRPPDKSGSAASDAAHDPDKLPTKHPGAYRGLARLFAATVTATFVLALVGISLDIVAWQCATPDSTCATSHWYLAFLARGEFTQTGRRLAVAAAVPIAGILVLWYLGARTWNRYEAYEGDTDVDGEGLNAPGFWRGKPLVGRLRALHVTIAFGTLDAVLTGVLATHDRTRTGWVLAGITGAVLFLAVVALLVRGMVDRDRPGRWAEGYARVLRWLAVLLTVAVLGYAWRPRPDWATHGGLPGYGTGITVLFAAQIGLLLLLALVAVFQRCPGQYLGGLAGPVIGSLGLAVAAAFTAGISYRVADYLDKSATPVGPRSAKSLELPASLQWAALGMVATVVVAGLVALGAWLFLLPRLRRKGSTIVDGDFPGKSDTDRGRASSIAATVADAKLIDHNGQLLLWGYIPLGIAAIAVTVAALAGIGPLDLVPAGSGAATVLTVVTGLGTYLIGLAALGLMALGTQAYRNQSVRRVVGIAWDLGTFWPRAGHPLAPPCYAERVVPELVARTGWLAARGRVILSGHSQGSVLVAATVLQLPSSTVDNVALLTYGSPLRRLYGRFFPAYVNDKVLATVDEGVSGRWINLWRDTDPIGGPIGEPAEDRRFVDPAGFPIPPGDTAYPKAHGHSDYVVDSAFGTAVSELSGAVAVVA
jgi:uncharacterized membrane protein YhaH (DUF805 family)